MRRKTSKRIQTGFLGWPLRIVAVVALVAVNLGSASVGIADVPPGGYVEAGSVDLTGYSSPKLTAVDPMAWGISGDVMPARPFLYSVDANGITITRFNDNEIVGYWPWPTDVIYTVLPDGSFTGLIPPTWEPVAMTVSYPLDSELANRVKEIPDLTPPWTFVYVVMAHSGYEWQSSVGSLRDTLAPSTGSAESSMLVQIDVSDPSFSTSRDPIDPSGPHIAAAILGHGAGQPVYDRKTGNVYIGNMPSMSLPTNLASFVSVIGRIPPEVAAEEAEIPGISKPVIRCGPQHPESGIPVGRPQAYACYDPSGEHPIDDNEHVGAYGEFEWEFRNLPDWLTAHNGVLEDDDIVRGSDGILYGTPLAEGEWYAEARVHNLDDPYGVFSDWHPIHLLVTPDAEYLPIRAQFATGVPVAYPLDGTGSCDLSVTAPDWVETVEVDNGCIVMGTAPLDGEYYNFTMTDFRETGYADIPIVFSGNVFGEYGFVPLPEGVRISGMAWHQVSKEADPSTETPVLSLEYIGVDPDTGQLWHILAPPGQPQPPNERPAETALTLDVVSKELDSSLEGSGFGEVAVEADRDIYVAADGGVIKVSGGAVSTIPLGFTPSSLSLDSDLRTAISGVEPGQVDHGVLWAAGAGGVVVIDTDAWAEAQTFSVSGASSVSVDYPTQYAYVANGSSSVAIFAPREFEGQNDPRPRPPLEPRIWSSEEISFNRGFATLADGPFLITATGDLPITLELLDEGNLPLGITFVDNGDGTATVSGVPGPETEGDHAFAVTATNSEGVYAQALDITVQTPPAISSDPTTTFYAGSASSFTVFGTGYPTPIFYTWNEGVLEAAGVQLVDNEDGTASLVGTPTTPGPYEFLLEATSGCPPDAQQTFTLNVDEGPSAPAITSLNTATWAAVGAPFSPDPFTVTSIGSPTPALSVVTAEGQTGLPPGVTFIDNGDSTAMFGAACASFYPTMSPECLGLLEEGTQGEYTFTIQATNSEATTDQTFTLNLVHDTSLLGADPSTLSFATDGTYEPEAAVNLTTLGDVLPYAAVATADWLKTTPESGWMPGSITVSANAAGLAPGTYTGTVIVGSAGTEGPFATIAVTLEVLGVLEEGEVGVWPSALSFDYHVNDGITPPPQPVWVLSGGGLPLEYTVSIEGGKWLSAPASGTAPDGFLVYVDPGVGVGMHVANLTIDPDGEGEDDDSQTIPVTLVKTAGDADVIQIMLDVGEGPEGLTVDLNTHDVFITSSSGSAEAAEESGTAVEVPTTGPPEPQTVFHIDPLALTVEGETVVHSEGEYIAVNSTTGRVYQASEGTSELAVINGYTDEAVAFIPLTIPEGPCIPYQIAVDEAQNIIYVGAKSPEPEGTYPDPLIPDENGNYGCKAIRELPSDEAEPGQEELDCWHAGPVFVIDGYTNQVVSYFLAGDDPEGVVFAAATGKVYASNEDDGTITVAQGAVRNGEDSITPPYVIGTIIQGSLEEGWWVPTCDEHNYCGQRGEDSEEFRNLSLWPERSACYGIDDEAEEADKMTVDPDGNVYIIDDRYRVAKIDGQTDEVVQVIEIPGYDCEVTLPDDSPDVLRNTANNIAYMPLGQGKLYVVSEQNTISLIEWKYLGKRTLTNITTLTVPGASELDAITTDWTLNQVYVTDEELPALWILKGSCANGVGIHCVQ